MRSNKSFESRTYFSVSFYKLDSITDTKTVLEEIRTAKALKVTLAHNADTISEYISFFHKMSSQQNYSVLFVRL